MNKEFLMCVSFLFALSIAFSSCARDNKPSASANPFIGSWKAVKFEDYRDVPNAVWTFSSSSLTMTQDGVTFSGSYTYNPASDPKTIDIEITQASSSGIMDKIHRSLLGIYRFNDPNTLTLKTTTEWTSIRPRNFTVEKDYDRSEFRKQ